MFIRKNAFLLVMLCLIALTVAGVVTAQVGSQQVVTGNWTVNIHAADKTMTEQWMLKQDGTKLTGTVKNDRGTLPLTGTIEGTVLRAVVTEGAAEHQIHIYVNGTKADGTIQIGRDVLLLEMARAH